MKRIMFLVSLGLFFTTTQLFAQEADKPVTAKFLIEVRVEYGGDEILQVFFTNGEDQTMRAGQGGFIALGGELQFANVRQLMLGASLGFKFNTTAADNANIRLTRLPL